MPEKEKTGKKKIGERAEKEMLGGKERRNGERAEKEILGEGDWVLNAGNNLTNEGLPLVIEP